jgi:hypothetical protein
MERTYRLEFNEKQQHFRLDNYSQPENTFGYVTIFEHCSDFEWKVLKLYIQSKGDQKLTIEKVKSYAGALKCFWHFLISNGVHITKS